MSALLPGHAQQFVCKRTGLVYFAERLHHTPGVNRHRADILLFANVVAHKALDVCIENHPTSSPFRLITGDPELPPMTSQVLTKSGYSLRSRKHNMLWSVENLRPIRLRLGLRCRGGGTSWTPGELRYVPLQWSADGSLRPLRYGIPFGWIRSLATDLVRGNQQ